MPEATGVPAGELRDDDLERELRQMYATRGDTFFGGTDEALDTHTARMLELEGEFRRRFPERVRPDQLRTREGSRAHAGQEP